MATPKMTVKQHADKELALKADIASLVTEMNEGNYRTKIEKQALAMKLELKREELKAHIAIPLSDLDLG